MKKKPESRKAEYAKRSARQLGVPVAVVKKLDAEFARDSFSADVAALKSELIDVIKRCQANDTPRVVFAALMDLALALSFRVWGRERARDMWLGVLEVAEPIPGEAPLRSHDG